MKKHIFTLLLCVSSLLTYSQKALSFDGTNDYVTVPDNNALDITGSITVEAWIYPTNSSATQVVVGKNDGGATANMAYMLRLTSSGMVFEVGDGSSTWYQSDYANFSVLTLNTWHHVVGYFNTNTNVIGIYVDGVEIGTPNNGPTGNLKTTTTPLFIGRYDATYSQYFIGKIDEVRIWNVARTQAQIKYYMYRNISASTTGLVAHYKMNETSGTLVANSCTNTSGIDGTNSGATIVDSPIQFVGNALNFDGTNNYVTVPDNNSLDFSSSSSFTLELWIKNLGWRSDLAAQHLIDKANSDVTNYRFYIENTGTQAAPIIKLGYWNQAGGGVTSTATFSKDVWVHIALTVTPTTTKFYINGTESGSFSSYAAGPVNAYPLTLGGLTAVSYRYFQGIMDEVRIWNVARTASEIANNMNAEIDPTTSGLVSYYTFNTGVASDAGSINAGLTIATDHSGSNNGTLTNFALSGSTSNYVGQNGSLTVLPLKWYSFTAKNQNKNVLLSWSTAMEQNTKDFIVQHSSNGTTWINVTTILAAGNSNSIKSYNYLHTSPIKGNNYYRILQRDLDENTSYSEVRMVKVNLENLGFSVLVNPVTYGQLQINCSAIQLISLYSNGGKLLWSKQFTAGTHSIDVSGNAKGIYLLKAGEQTEKIVVQ